MNYLKSLLISTLLILAPVKAALTTLLVLIVADLITGVMAAKKRNEPITSAALRRTVSKLFVYELALIIAYLAEHFLMSDVVPANKVVSGMVGMVELTSILENLNTISGQNLLKSVIDKLGSNNQ